MPSPAEEDARRYKAKREFYIKAFRNTFSTVVPIKSKRDLQECISILNSISLHDIINFTFNEVKDETKDR